MMCFHATYGGMMHKNVDAEIRLTRLVSPSTQDK